MRAGALVLSVLATLAAATVLAAPTGADAVRPVSGDLLPDEGRYLRREVPDLLVRDARGVMLRLSGLWADRPILLALVFTRCAGVCSPFLSSLRSAEDSVGGSGRDYRTVVLSFDPRDTADDMAAMAARLGLEARRDWTFGVADADDVERLARAVGFWSRWDESREQFDHPAMLVAVDGGRVVRLSVGGMVEPVRLEEIVRELRGEFVAGYPVPGRVLFRCFEYDPRTGRWALDWGFLLLAVPAAVTFLGTAAAFAAARRSD
jgi:protein SCO1/2